MQQPRSWNDSIFGLAQFANSISRPCAAMPGGRRGDRAGVRQPGGGGVRRGGCVERLSVERVTLESARRRVYAL